MQKCSTASVLVDLRDDLDSGKPGWKSRVSFYPLVAAEISPAVRILRTEICIYIQMMIILPSLGLLKIVQSTPYLSLSY
jgi:hypothetical protein